MRDTPKQKRSFKGSGFLRVWIVGAVAGVVALGILALFEQLRAARIADLDALFVKLMTIHHVGAVKMAYEELRGGSDTRLRVMAHAIRHEQQEETALTDCVDDENAVVLAVSNMFADTINKTDPDLPGRASCQP